MAFLDLVFRRENDGCLTSFCAGITCFSAMAEVISMSEHDSYNYNYCHLGVFQGVLKAIIGKSSRSYWCLGLNLKADSTQVTIGIQIVNL